MRLEGRGITGNQPGDCYVILSIALPPADTEAAKDLYRNLEQKRDFNPRTKLGVPK
jgi:curved DNA-binding protein